MLDLQSFFEFSRLNCVAICSFLIPANLIVTLTTLVLVATDQSLSKMRWSKTIASWLAVALFLHVSTWFMIGVVTPVTFILFGLGTTCLIANVMAVAYRQKIAQRFSAKLLPPLT